MNYVSSTEVSAIQQTYSETLPSSLVLWVLWGTIVASAMEKIKVQWTELGSYAFFLAFDTPPLLLADPYINLLLFSRKSVCQGRPIEDTGMQNLTSMAPELLLSGEI